MVDNFSSLLLVLAKLGKNSSRVNDETAIFTSKEPITSFIVMISSRRLSKISHTDTSFSTNPSLNTMDLGRIGWTVI